MKNIIWIALAVLCCAAPSQVFAVPGDSDPRAMGLGQAYTALARGPQSAFWNPANLALSGNRKFHWNFLGAGFSTVFENNSFSMTTYNDNFTESNDKVSPNGSKYYISPKDKDDIMSDIPGEGLRMNFDFEPMIAAGIPINGGIAFPLPAGMQGAVSIGLNMGFEGEVPKDMFELFLFGNDFARNRLAAGKDGGYDISDWDGSGWAVGSLNFSGAKAMMPAPLKPYLSEFTVGGTFKVSGGAYGEALESGGGGLISRFDGADVDAYVIAQSATGVGFGVDVGVAAISKNRKLTISAGLLNLLDTFSWSGDPRQDSLFIKASDLVVTRFADPENQDIESVLDNEDVDGDGDIDFHKELASKSFSRSLPAMLRLGVAYNLLSNLTVVGNWDQAFSTGFGVETAPRIATGVEYRLVSWFPTRFGLSAGGRGSSSSIGFAFGPFNMSRLQVSLLETAFVTRGGFFPGVAKGTALSVQFFRLNLI
ncbi:MAG: hypothetical protein ACI906_000593 [Candidatus Latescibacterota bacterium]|jgi:hypothetical protein